MLFEQHREHGEKVRKGRTTDSGPTTRITVRENGVVAYGEDLAGTRGEFTTTLVNWVFTPGSEWQVAFTSNSTGDDNLVLQWIRGQVV